jgi:phosphoribosylaminoimidazole-succinocarboxamide synthase
VQEESAKRGLILVDTKFEFGKDEAGNIFLIDEVLTPDSSRYSPRAANHARAGTRIMNCAISRGENMHESPIPLAPRTSLTLDATHAAMKPQKP